MVRIVEKKRYEVFFDATRDELDALACLLRQCAGDNAFLKTLLCSFNNTLDTRGLVFDPMLPGGIRASDIPPSGIRKAGP